MALGPMGVAQSDFGFCQERLYLIDEKEWREVSVPEGGFIWLISQGSIHCIRQLIRYFGTTVNYLFRYTEGGVEKILFICWLRPGTT